eukprot:8377017-Pyramimonas_sp.AAC.1
MSADRICSASRCRSNACSFDACDSGAANSGERATVSPGAGSGAGPTRTYTSPVKVGSKGSRGS